MVTGDTKVMGKRRDRRPGAEHHRRRAHPPRRPATAGCARATAPGQRHGRRPRPRRLGGAPRAGARGRATLRRRAGECAGARRARRRRRGRRGDEGSHPRRPRQRPARDGRQERRRGRARRSARAACRPRCAPRELLGIDPLHVANEGKAVLGVRPERRRARARGAALASARPARGDHRHAPSRERARLA